MPSLLVVLYSIHAYAYCIICVEQTFEVWPKTVVIILEKTVQQQGHIVGRVLSVQSRLKKIKGEVHQDYCCCQGHVVNRVLSAYSPV
jgi:hypothetical protein